MLPTHGSWWAKPHKPLLLFSAPGPSSTREAWKHTLSQVNPLGRSGPFVTSPPLLNLQKMPIHTLEPKHNHLKALWRVHGAVPGLDTLISKRFLHSWVSQSSGKLECITDGGGGGLTFKRLSHIRHVQWCLSKSASWWGHPGSWPHREICRMMSILSKSD